MPLISGYIPKILIVLFLCEIPVEARSVTANMRNYGLGIINAWLWQITIFSCNFQKAQQICFDFSRKHLWIRHNQKLGIIAATDPPLRPKSLIKLTMVAAGRNGPHREWFIRNRRVGSLGIHPPSKRIRSLPEVRVFMAFKCPFIATTMHRFIGALIGRFESHK